MDKHHIVDTHAPDGGDGQRTNCRDCADEGPICPHTGERCDASGDTATRATDAPEPVAWRYRVVAPNGGKGKWCYSSEPTTSGACIEADPLYATPPAGGGGDFDDGGPYNGIDVYASLRQIIHDAYQSGRAGTGYTPQVESLQSLEPLIRRLASGGGAKVPVPQDVMEARAQGRAEALAIVLGLDAEEGLSEYTDSVPPGPDGEWGTQWNEAKLRELLRADDTAWSLLQEAEGEYWHNLGLREEAQRLAAGGARVGQEANRG